MKWFSVTLSFFVPIFVSLFVSVFVSVPALAASEYSVDLTEIEGEHSHIEPSSVIEIDFGRSFQKIESVWLELEGFAQRGWGGPMRDGEDTWSLDLDVGEVRAGDLCEPLCELELELIRGSTVRLYDAALELLDDIPLTVGFVSKSARGYALVEGKRARQPLAKALGRMREALEGAPEARREALEPELRILEEECTKARRDDDSERLHHSPRFARAALVLGRLAAGE